jgi:hypothetical protein
LPAAAVWALTSVTVNGREVLDEGLDLRDSDLDDVVVSFSDTIGSIAGTARAMSGAPSATAVVIAFPAEYQPWIESGMNSRHSRTAVATKLGAFTMTGLPAGDYLVAAFDDADLGDPADPAVINAIAPLATRVTLASGEKRSLDLRLVRPAAR